MTMRPFRNVRASRFSRVDYLSAAICGVLGAEADERVAMMQISVIGSARCTRH